MAWNEASLHRWLASRARPTALALGLGNDAAVLRRATGRSVLCCDQTVEGIHFEPGTPAARVGAKAAARALSDLAASAARPGVLLVAGAFAASVEERWIRAVLTAIESTARAHGAELVGGDLTALPAGSPALLAVTAHGRLAPGDAAVARDRARPGHVVVLTGAVGGSRLGRHLGIEPRVTAGRWLARNGARAMMDVSDGLALDLSRLAAASGVRIVLDHVPVHRDARRAAKRSGRPALEHALCDGEDHELVATLPAAAWARARRRRGAAGVPITEVGRVVRGAGLEVPGPGNGAERVEWSGAGGWIHGG